MWLINVIGYIYMRICNPQLHSSLKRKGEVEQTAGTRNNQGDKIGCFCFTYKQASGSFYFICQMALACSKSYQHCTCILYYYIYHFFFDKIFMISLINIFMNISNVKLGNNGGCLNQTSSFEIEMGGAFKFQSSYLAHEKIYTSGSK